MSTKYCNCNNSNFQKRENVIGNSSICTNCGKPEFKQFSKNSTENSEYTGSVQVSARGYFITITDGDVSHQLKQREVKDYEERTGLTGQELADLLANKTKSLSYNYNGKYGTSSISFTYLTKKEEEKHKAYLLELEEKNKKQEIIKKAKEEEKNNILNKEQDFNLKITNYLNFSQKSMKKFGKYLDRIGDSSNNYATLSKDSNVKNFLYSLSRAYSNRAIEESKKESKYIKEIRFTLTTSSDYKTDNRLDFSKIEKLVKNVEIEHWNEEKELEKLMGKKEPVDKMEEYMQSFKN